MFRKKFIDRLREKYQKGGQRTTTTVDPKLMRFLRQNNMVSQQPDNTGKFKPTDTSIKNKMYQAAMRMTNFTMSPDAVPGLPSQFVAEATGIPSALRLPTSATEVYKDPSAKNIANVALDVAGVAGPLSIIKSAVSPVATTVNAASNTSRIGNVIKVLDKAKKVKLANQNITQQSSNPLYAKNKRYKANPAINRPTIGELLKKSPVAVSETTAAPIVNINVDKYKVDPNQAKPDLSSFFPTSMQKGGMYDETTRIYHEGGVDMNNWGAGNNTTEHFQLPHHTGGNTGGNTNMYGPGSPNSQGPKPEFGVHFGLDPYADYSNPLSFAKLALQGPGIGVHGTAIDDLKQRGIDKGREVINKGKSAIKKVGSYISGLFEEGGERIIPYQMGGVSLPGGEMQPIPGTDAVEFIGQSHDQGGIMVDPQTEVEGGETMDQVTMAKHGGKRKDYFFSSYLKRGGRSFADIHKDILRKGGNQKDIDMLAKMQEKAAGRNPKKVAKLGGIAKYQVGGSTYNQGNLGNINLSNYEIIDDGASVTDVNLDGYPNVIEPIDPSDLNENSQNAFNFLQRFQSDRLTLDELREKYPDYPHQDIFSLQIHHKEVLDGNANADGSPTEKGKDREQEIKELEEKNIKEKEENEKKENKEKKDAPVYVSPFATKQEERAFQDWANTQGYNTRGYGWGKSSQAIYDQYIGDYKNYLDNIDKEEKVEVEPAKIDNDGDGIFSDVDLDDNDPNVGLKVESESEKRKREQKERRESRRPSEDVKHQRIFDNLQARLDAGRTLDADEQAAYDAAVNYLGEDRMTTKARKAEADRIAAEQQQFEDYRKAALSQGATPELAKIAGAAQLAPAVYAMTYKQPAAEQAVYTPGFTEPIVAERGKASDLERVNYNAERAANAAEMRGINRFIETSGGGPANIINKMSAYARKQAGDMKITAAETRANIDIANREAQLEQQMELSNLQRAQQAATVNAQMQRQETARMDQIGVLNAQARQKLKDDQEAMKYQGIGLAAQGIAGIAGDVMAYRGQERLAKAYGNQGIYERDLLRNYLRQTDEKYQNMSDDDLNKYITQFNTQA